MEKILLVILGALLLYGVQGTVAYYQAYRLTDENCPVPQVRAEFTGPEPYAICGAKSNS